jgi:hypothetical protein
MAEFNVWLLIVGLAAGAAVTWLVVGTIARNDDDIAAEERATEAAWIARTIAEHGGRAPLKLVDQILTLHRRYLKGGPGVPQPGSEPAAPPPEPAAPEAPTPRPDVEQADAPATRPRPERQSPRARRPSRAAQPEPEEPEERVAS